VVLVITCDSDDVTNVSLTGPCAGQTVSCIEPEAGTLAGCNAVSFAATGAGTCGATVTFANGFVYTGSFTYSERQSACASCGPQLVPSPEVVPVYCSHEAGAVPEAGPPANDGGADAADARGGDTGASESGPSDAGPTDAPQG
jgi:hypothetical protein